MADAVNAGFARSEELKKEWARLKRQMLAISPDAPDASNRRNAIHVRMDQVMTDMATVLTETRRLIPVSDLHIDDDPPAPPPPQQHHVQYSARKLHIIQRTYESSSEDSDIDCPPSLNQKVDTDFDDIDVSSLRQDMMNDASPNDVITVEGKGIRASILLFKEKLRKPENNKRSEEKDRRNIIPPSPRGKPLLTHDREDLSLEQSRLERESRRLKRKPDRTPDDDSRLEDIAGRLSRISSTLADAADSQLAQASPAVSPAVSPTAKRSNQPPNKKGMLSSKPPRLERSTPFTENDEDLTFDTVEEMVTPASARGNEKLMNSKRKKGWMALEAGVASFRALSRNIRQSTVISAREPKTESAAGSMNRGSGRKPETSPVSTGENVFTDTADRLQKRGELLNNVANGAEAMHSDADDMLAAARTLRQRNQKSGFFS